MIIADGAIGALRAAETARKQASHDRWAAIQRSEHSASNPICIANAIVEWWSSAQIAALARRASVRGFRAVDDAVWAFLSETFEPVLAKLGAAALLQNHPASLAAESPAQLSSALTSQPPLPMKSP